MLLNKYQIAEVYPKFSTNIKEREIDTYISDAELFDIQPLLPTGMFSAIQSQLPIPQVAWDKNKTYAQGNIVFHVGRFYKCVTGNTDSIPPSANWAEAELLNFWLFYIKPIYCYSAVSRFITEHGVNFTQHGVRTMLDSTSEEISGQRRAEVKNNIDSKINHYQAIFSKRLKEVNNTFDGVTYNYDSCQAKPKPKFKLFQQGNKPNRDELYYQ